jgi:acyl carrier protein
MKNFEKLRSIICEQLGVDPAMVTSDSSIRDDLGGDDDDLFLLAMSIEEEFGISIGAPQQIKTVGDAVSVIEKHENCGQSPAELRFWSLKNSVMPLEFGILRAAQHGDFESVAALKAQRRSLKPTLEAIENHVWAELPEWYLKGMQSYGDKHEDSTIAAFDLGPDSFVALLKDGSVYLLNRDNVGENNVDSLKAAALLGQEIDNDFNWMRKKSKKLR